MSFIRRRSTSRQVGDLAVVLLQGHDAIERTATAHRDRWGLGSAQRWELEQTSARLRWTFDDHVVEAPAQIIGTYSPSASSWLWAWANDSLLPALCTASEAVREWGTARGHESLMQPRLDGVSAEQAADLAAISFRLTRAKGYYRVPAGNSELHLTFGTVAIKRDDAEPELFTINID